MRLKCLAPHVFAHSLRSVTHPSASIIHRTTLTTPPTVFYSQGMWSYCTLDHQSLVRFTFAIMDLNNSGVIEKGEVRNMVKIVFGKKNLDEKTDRMLQQLDVDKNGVVSSR